MDANYHNIVKTIIDTGIPAETVLLFLMFPVLATLVAIFRHVIGLSTMGFYISMLFGISYYFLGKDDYVGLTFGVPLTILIVLFATVFRRVTKTLRMHYLPRMSLLVGFISVIVLVGYSLLSHYAGPEVKFDSPFPIFVIIILAERFIALLIRKNEQLVTMRLGESITFGAVAYLLLTWGTLQTLLMENPQVLILIFVINYLVAGTSMLRLTEYLRFNQVFKQYEKEQKLATEVPETEKPS